MLILCVRSPDNVEDQKQKTRSMTNLILVHGTESRYTTMSKHMPPFMCQSESMQMPVASHVGG